MDWKILPSLFWICLLFIIVPGQRMPPPAPATLPPHGNPNAPMHPPLHLRAPPNAPPFNQNAPPVNPNAPPFNQNAPPINPNAPPFNPNAPLVNPNAPPFNPNAPLVNPNAPPFNPNAPPVNPNAPPFNPNAPPVNPNAPPFNPNAPLVNPNAPPVNPNTPPINPNDPRALPPLKSNPNTSPLPPSGNRPPSIPPNSNSPPPSPQNIQKKELPQGQLFFMLPKSVFFDLPTELIQWDKNTLQSIHPKQFSPFQIWFVTSKIMSSVDERFKSDYAFLIPPPFQKGIPTENMTQLLLTKQATKPDNLRVLIEESDGMLTSQKAVIAQRIRSTLQETSVLKQIVSSSKPAELFDMFSPRLILKTIPNIINIIKGMPEFTRFGKTAVQTKLFPRSVLSLWMRWVREHARLSKWTAKDILGRSAIGTTHAVQFTIMGLTCDEANLIDPTDVVPVILHYRHELYSLRNFNPDLSFDLNLRSCFLDNIVNYLKIKRNRNGNENRTEIDILSELNPREIVAIGGEVLSLIPSRSLERLSPEIRMKILEEIGSIGMLDLFHFATLEQLQWYANTLLKDNLSHRFPNSKQRRQTKEPDSKHIHQSPAELDSQTLQNDNVDDMAGRSTKHIDMMDDSPDPTEDQVEDPDPGSVDGKMPPTQDDSLPTARTGDDVPPIQPSISQQQIEVDTDIVKKLGNFLCYAEHIFVGNWNMQFFKDTLESKSITGEKTCCISTQNRLKWFELLKKAYGADTSTWNELQLIAIGDLLVTVPEEDLAKISREALAKAVHPIMKQSGFEQLIAVPGKTKRQRFITVCAEALGMEGTEMLRAYKSLMKKFTDSIQRLQISPPGRRSGQGQLAHKTCDTIRAAGSAAIGLTLDDIQQLTHSELFNCIEPLGKLDWDEQTKAEILNLLVQKLGLNFRKLKTFHLLEIGNLVTALKVNEDSFNGTTKSPIDVSQMDLKVPGSLDVISILGSKITDPHMLQVLADKFNADNTFLHVNPSSARPENRRIIVQSLGNILCGFKNEDVNSLFEVDAQLFTDCSPVLGKLEGCSFEVLSTLAKHATLSNYGLPGNWSRQDVETIGVVIAGLTPEEISTIPPESMQGLQPNAMITLPSSSISALTVHQISKMSYDSVKSILPIQRQEMMPTQQNAFNQILKTTSELDTNMDDDFLRFEGTRAVASDGIIGRTKGKDDQKDPQSHTTESPNTSPTTTTEGTTSTTSTTTVVPTSEGETAQKSGSQSNYKVIWPIIIIVTFSSFI